MRELGGNSVVMALWTIFLQLVIIAKQRNFARCVYFFFPSEKSLNQSNFYRQAIYSQILCLYARFGIQKQGCAFSAT